VAYWDTERREQPPTLLGEVRGTPTIRAFVPSRRSSRNEKETVDYNQAREVSALSRFALGLLPNYVERVSGEEALAGLFGKAEDWGLPVVLVFSTSSGTSSLLKALSGEYRRRLLIGELKADQNAAAMSKYSVQTFPTLLAFSSSTAEPLRFEGKAPTHFKLTMFFDKVALKKAVAAKPQRAAPPERKEEL